MKKLLLLLFSTLLILITSTNIIGCDSTTNTSTKSPADCKHSYSKIETEANCFEGGYATFKCSLCKNVYQQYENALGHTTTTGTCSRCGYKAEKQVWSKSYYVDEFNKPTSTAYIRNTEQFVGVFSNSATTNSKLYATFLIDADNVAVKLWGYGNLVVKAYSITYYNITILDEKGTKHYTTGTMYKNGDRIYFKDWSFVSLLQQNSKLSIYIEEDSKYGYHTTYLFEAKNGNFNSVYSDFYYN